MKFLRFVTKMILFTMMFSIFLGTNVYASSPEVVSETIGEIIPPVDKLSSGYRMTKTERSMYGEASLTVLYDYSMALNYARITGINRYSCSDPYMEYKSSYYDSDVAKVVFYDKTHQTYVTVQIRADELKLK